MTQVFSFPPLEAPGARILLLGTMPGVASLNAQQYYAHPRNAFWRIMADLFGIAADRPYAQRAAQLAQKGVVVWDVLQCCVRPGSLDAAIERDSELPNDIAGLLARQPGIARIGLNGGTAARLFKRHIEPRLPADRYTCIALPSTSPAHAGLSFERKLEAWRALIA